MGEGDHFSGTTVTGRLKRPTQGIVPFREHEASHPIPHYLVLLRAGFAVPVPSPGTAVGSYPTVSPLPHKPFAYAPDVGRYRFCGTFRRVAPPGCYPAPCSVEPGLSSKGLSPFRDRRLLLTHISLYHTNGMWQLVAWECEDWKGYLSAHGQRNSTWFRMSPGTSNSQIKIRPRSVSPIDWLLW